MKILYVCHRFPYPPKRGGKIRPFNMISHLAKSHHVTVASLVRSEEEAREGQGIQQHCQTFLMERVGSSAAVLRMIARLPTTVPSSMGYFHSPALANRIRRETPKGGYDLVFVHCSSVAQYVERIEGVPKILDFGDMDSQKWLDYAKVRRFPLSAGYRIEGVKLEREERRLARRFDCCTCTTRAEKEVLDGYGVGVPTEWFPNGVDSEYFKPTNEPYDSDLLCFVGRMDYYPNQECMFDFCENVLPLIASRRPAVRLVIVGANPSSRVRRLTRIPGVVVTGSVPDVRPYVHKAAVNVAPLNIARGTQNKILESLAMGVPVVCSSLAARGVDAVPEEHLLTADSAEDYADRVLRLLESPEERQRLAEAGRARLLSHHNWEKSMQKLDAVIEKCLSRRQGVRGVEWPVYAKTIS